METYEAKTANYEVFGASMTVNTQADIYSAETVIACQKCQCNCRSCIGGKAPEDADIFNKAEAENALEKLLAA